MRGRGKHNGLTTNPRKANGLRELALPNQRAFNSLPQKMQDKLLLDLELAQLGKMGQQPVIETPTNAKAEKINLALTHFCQQRQWIYLATTSKNFTRPQQLGIQLAAQFNYLAGQQGSQWTVGSKAFFADTMLSALDPYEENGLVGAFGANQNYLRKQDLRQLVADRIDNFELASKEQTPSGLYPKGILIAAPGLEAWSEDVLRTWVGASKRTGMQSLPLVWLSLPQNEREFRANACQADGDSTMAYSTIKWD